MGTPVLVAECQVVYGTRPRHAGKCVHNPTLDGGVGIGDWGLGIGDWARGQENRAWVPKLMGTTTLNCIDSVRDCPHHEAEVRIGAMCDSPQTPW